MEPITTALFVSLPIIGAGVFMLATKKRKPKESAIVAARERSLARMNEKAFADTSPLDESRFDSLEFTINNGLIVTEDAYNTSSIPLSLEQLRTIEAIFEGAYADPIHRPKNAIGASAKSIAGVPSVFTAFDDLNKVKEESKTEYLAPEYQWPKVYHRD